MSGPVTADARLHADRVAQCAVAICQVHTLLTLYAGADPRNKSTPCLWELRERLLAHSANLARCTHDNLTSAVETAQWVAREYRLRRELAAFDVNSLLRIRPLRSFTEAGREAATRLAKSLVYSWRRLVRLCPAGELRKLLLCGSCRAQMWVPPPSPPYQPPSTPPLIEGSP